MTLSASKNPVTGERIARGARISKCGLYRYVLGRRWSPHGEPATFVMLNPSTADASLDDPTIRRCIGFAKSWGAGGLHVLNLYALRATDPRELARADDPVGPDCDEYLYRHLRAAVMAGRPVVAAWGAHPFARQRARDVHGMLHAVDWRCLGTTADGSPRHPLYLRRDAELAPWTPR